MLSTLLCDSQGKYTGKPCSFSFLLGGGGGGGGASKNTHTHTQHTRARGRLCFGFLNEALQLDGLGVLVQGPDLEIHADGADVALLDA